MENLISLILLGLGGLFALASFVGITLPSSFGHKNKPGENTKLFIMGAGGVALIGYALLRLFA